MSYRTEVERVVRDLGELHARLVLVGHLEEAEILRGVQEDLFVAHSVYYESIMREEGEADSD